MGRLIHCRMNELTIRNSPMPTDPGDVTRLVADLSQGQPEETSKLIPVVYDELRRLARHYLRQERPDHTLQTTALVHEAYLRLVEHGEITWQNQAQFIGVAARVMRRVLVDYARARQSGKRGGLEQKVSLEIGPLIFTPEQTEELLALDHALTKLAELSPRQCRIIELRFFGGLTVEETAELIGIAPKTVKRDWTVARAWLHREIGKGARSAKDKTTPK